MITTYTFPILQSLDVDRLTAYEIIFEGTTTLRLMYELHKATGNQQKALELFNKVQQGDRLLYFMRLNSVGSNFPEDVK